jgi:dTDP-4-amino-4,6-dideoxygalactose transaminase
MDYIPYGTQFIEEDDIAAVTETMKSGYLTTGSKVLEFEKELCKATGAKYAVAVSNGTAALHLSALCLDLKKDDEVIVSPFTFAASANCILYANAKPIFADIDYNTMLISLSETENKITDKTKAIIPVNYGGEVCDLDNIFRIAKKYNLAVIQDCAHSLGSMYKNKHQGVSDGLQTWSFHPVKTITTGEGGAITLNDEHLYKRLLKLRTHGITRDTKIYEFENQGDWYYEMQDLGFNYRLTDIQCALGISQLKKLDRFAKRRAEITENKYSINCVE